MQVRGNAVSEARNNNLVVIWTKQAVQEMKATQGSGRISLSPIKRLQRKLESILNSTVNKKEAYFAFFLSIFIQDLSYNLTGDFPYSEQAEQEKQKIYGKLIEHIDQFTEAIVQENEQMTQLACIEMVNTYLDGVKSVNNILKKEKE